MKNYYGLLFILFLFIISPLLSAGSPNDAMAILKRAEKAYHSQEYDKAAQLYREVLKSKPDDAKANFRLGYIYLDREQPALAVKHLKKAHAVSPGIHKELPHYLATAYQQNHNFDDALALYFELLQKTNPKKTYQYQLLEKRILECASGKDLLESPVSYIVENMGQPLNSKFADHVPVPTSDGSEMYFTSRRHRQGVATLKNNETDADEDIFSISLDKKGDSPVRLEPSLNTLNHDAVISISADNQTLYLYNDANGGDIYFSTKTKDGKWSKPKPMPAPINSKYFEPSISFSKDGNFAFFSSDRPGGFGGLDLYISMKMPDGTWGEAMNLGHSINTPYDEDAPFLGPMEEVLYFSSRGHNSMGGYDIFKSTLNGSMWSRARNLGYPINSAADDIYFTMVPDRQLAYLSSNRAGGFGEKDIYVVKLKEEEEATPAQPVALPVVTSPQPEAKKETEKPLPLVAIKISGLVTDAATKQPLPGARIIISDNKLRQVVHTIQSDSVTGAYTLNLETGKNYGLAIEKDNYLFLSENISLESVKTTTALVKDYSLKKMETGAKIVLKNIFFDSGKASLNEDSATELERLIELMELNPTIKVEISGHTDNTGSPALNQTLSVKRADAVVAYLVSKGVAKERLQAKGYGFEKPIATNKTPEGRTQNRRTEFAILAK